MRYASNEQLSNATIIAESLKAGYNDARRFVFPQHLLKASRHSGTTRKIYADGYKLGQADTNFRFVAFFYRVFLGLKHGRNNVPVKPVSFIVKA